MNQKTKKKGKEKVQRVRDRERAGRKKEEGRRKKKKKEGRRRRRKRALGGLDWTAGGGWR